VRMGGSRRRWRPEGRAFQGRRGKQSCLAQTIVDGSAMEAVTATRQHALMRAYPRLILRLRPSRTLRASPLPQRHQRGVVGEATNGQLRPVAACWCWPLLLSAPGCARGTCDGCKCRAKSKQPHLADHLVDTSRPAIPFPCCLPAATRLFRSNQPQPQPHPGRLCHAFAMPPISPRRGAPDYHALFQSASDLHSGDRPLLTPGTHVHHPSPTLPLARPLAVRARDEFWSLECIHVAPNDCS